MIAIINYGLGNLLSIQNMCKYLGIDSKITSDPIEIESADKLILPGVGNFKSGMENLQKSGLDGLLNELVVVKKKKILGICLGAQLMTHYSEEGSVEGLKWINAKTIKFRNSDANIKIPHMGWSELLIKKQNDLLNDLPPTSRFYHVHSYHFDFIETGEVIGTSFYGYEFATAFNRENIFGTQFHPEKSHKFGMKIIENFSKLN